jgi:glycosyltransferase involved in cell wall biosynthesis
LKVLLLSAYDAQSHRHWRELLVSAFSEIEWTVLTLPPRYFNWRIRGNSLSWAFGERKTLEQNYDMILATSMVDLSTLRGFVPALSFIPTLLYFHENQFAFPKNERQFESVEPKMLNLYSALAADHLAFNSDYNRHTFITGVDELLGKMPDYVPPQISSQLLKKSSILPVPLLDSIFAEREAQSNGVLSLVWNHRWEYDKAPERFFGAVKRVLNSGVLVDLHIVGQQFRKQPAVFEEMKSYLEHRFPGRLKHWGYIESLSEYRNLLSYTDVVISTAIHDFQGLAVLEAVAAGCVPLLPRRLCYQEWVDDGFLYDSDLNDPEKESIALANRILELNKRKSLGEMPCSPDISQLSMSALKTQYQEIFEKTILNNGLESI